MRAHPRSRGENRPASASLSPRRGSSPLTRGKPLEGLAGLLSGRLIPAHAGKTCPPRTCTWVSSAHPRSRGENAPPLNENPQPPGSSPLTRGKPRAPRCNRRGARLIPAHAGKTRCAGMSNARFPAHPRSRGENQEPRRVVDGRQGSSPLTRGKQLIVRTQFSVLRLIPAHAGKTLPDLRFYCADRSDLGNP